MMSAPSSIFYPRSSMPLPLPGLQRPIAPHHFLELPAAHVIDRAADRDLARDERRLAQRPHIRSNALLQVGERQEIPARSVRIQVGTNLGNQIRVREGQ